MGVCYWPENAPGKYTMDAYESAFPSIGYERSDSIIPENGFVNVALFSKGEQPTHASRQIQSNIWTSKLGKNVDLNHELHALCGELYGDVSLFMTKQES